VVTAKRTSNFRWRCDASARTTPRQGAGALKLVGLDGFGKRHRHDIRRHEQARLDRPRLVQDPPVLLMDEPFAALDEQTRMTMGDELLAGFVAATGKTVVFVTHSLTGSGLSRPMR